MSNLAADAWEDVECPLCPRETPATSFLSCGDRFLEPALHNYHLVKCTGCGFVYLSPRPALALSPSAHLQDGYDPFISFTKPKSLSDRLYLFARQWTGRWKRSLVESLIPAGSNVLDIGCGTGEFLNVIKERFVTVGIEPEPRAGEWARKRYGLEVKTGDLNSVKLPPRSFKLITLWHALEHIPQPLEALQSVKNLLIDGGIVLIALPNINSYDADFYGPDWVALDAPRHLWHFTPATIGKIAERAGLRVEFTRILPLDLFYNVLLSESIYLKSEKRRHWLFSPIRMGIAVFGSLVRDLFERQASGMVYLLTLK